MIKNAKRIALYLIGLLIIALGINVSKLSGLGISPVSSIPGVLAKQFPNFSLGSMVIIVYCILVLAQAAVLRKGFKIKNTLGVPVALIFGLMVDFVGTAEFKLTIAGIPLGIDKVFRGLLVSFPQPQGVIMRFVYLAASIIIIGTGVYIYLLPKLVPMPAEGLAVAISAVSGKAFGNCKTAVDVSLIAIASVLQMIFFGGIASFGIGKAVVGIGTVLSAVCVGQTVKALNKILKHR